MKAATSVSLKYGSRKATAKIVIITLQFSVLPILGGEEVSNGCWMKKDFYNQNVCATLGETN